MKESIIKEVLDFTLPKYKQLPDLDLYMDQLITYINATLAPLKTSEDQVFITTAMVNNYVKQKLIPATQKKRYNRSQIAYLLAISFLKQVFSIQEILAFITIQDKYYDTETAYDYLCTELENALHAVFTESPLPEDSSTHKKEVRIFVRDSVLAFARKLHVQKLLNCYMATNEIETPKDEETAK